MAYRRKSYSRSYSPRKSYGKKRRSTSAPKPQIVKFVIEHVAASPVSRPENFGLIEKPKGGKAKF